MIADANNYDKPVYELTINPEIDEKKIGYKCIDHVNFKIVHGYRT